MIAWEALLAAVAFALIGALLALRFAEAFSAEEGADRTAGGASGESDRPSAEGDPAGSSASVSDEDRVLELLSKEDGRLRQQAVVDRTGWSKSKVSRLLSTMEERGTIRKVPVGRENVIELADEERSDDTDRTKRPDRGG